MSEQFASYAFTFIIGVLAGLLLAVHHIIRHEFRSRELRLKAWRIFWRSVFWRGE